MKLFLLLFLIFSALNTSSSSAESTNQAITIDECYRLALKKSTSLKISENQISQSEFQIDQARALFFPSLSLQGSTSKADESTNSLAKNLASTQQTNSNLNLTQNLFQGFRDSATAEQRKQIKKSFEENKKATIQQIYLDVALNFYAILVFQSDIAQYHEQIHSTQQRNLELKKAKKSGRARDSDVLNSESSIASIEAVIAKTEGLIVSSNQSLHFLTGLPDNSVLIDKKNLEVNEQRPIEYWLQDLNHLPAIQQSELLLQASDSAIKVARSSYFPSLSISANYYLSDRTGINEGVNWDASLVLSFPLFSGGLTNAQVSEAKVIRSIRNLERTLKMESLEQQIRTNYANLQSDLLQLERYSQSATLLETSYKLTMRDNNLGVTTNTEVLTALQNWQESKRNRERSRITAQYDYQKLILSTDKNSQQEAK